MYILHIMTENRLLQNSGFNDDGFGRIRVSNPTTLYEVHFPYNKQPQKIEEIISGSGISTHINGLSYINMSVSGSNGSVIRQSREYIPYQPGKSKLILLSGVLGNTNLSSNITTRIGHFDSYDNKTSEPDPIGNGHFFEMVGNAITPVINVVERSFYNNSKGWGYENRIAQSNWNIDMLNGRGQSYIKIDFTKNNVFVIDMQWLGVGQVRMGIYSNNQIYYCHIFNVRNRPSTFNFDNSTYSLQNIPYSQFGKLPIRYEISSSGNNSGSMNMICSTVLSEGGFIPTGITGTFGYTSPTSLVSNRNNIIFALKLNHINPRISLKLNGYSLILNGTNDYICYRLDLNPIINGTLLFENINQNNFTYGQKSIGNGAYITSSNINSGYLLQTGFLNNSIHNYQNITLENLSLLPTINSNISGDSDIITLSAIILSGSGVDVYASCNVLAIL
jgi:hypothetical protein